MNHIKATCQHYHLALVDKVETKCNAEKDQKFRSSSKEIQELNNSVVTLDKTIPQLQKKAGEFAFDAEKKANLVFYQYQML